MFGVGADSTPVHYDDVYDALKSYGGVEVHHSFQIPAALPPRKEPRVWRGPRTHLEVV
jgi:hypothetical protein